jgi:hypothetical protein
MLENDQLPLDRGQVKINVRRTPLFPAGGSRYQLSDFSYGEWILFEGKIPKYYFNSFDEVYSGLFDEVHTSIEGVLIEKFKAKGVRISFTPTGWGIPIIFRSEVVELVLEKLPIAYLT